MKASKRNINARNHQEFQQKSIRGKAEKFIKKDDTLSSISQISQVEDAKGELGHKNNESREYYEQALGELLAQKKLQESKLQKVEAKGE